jgi:hypothetical protein
LKVYHFLYFSQPSAVGAAAPRLHAAGYSIDIQMSGNQWRVRASHEMDDDRVMLEAKVAELNEIAATEGGEYDGMERETLPTEADR